MRRATLLLPEPAGPSMAMVSVGIRGIGSGVFYVEKSEEGREKGLKVGEWVRLKGRTRTIVHVVAIEERFLHCASRRAHRK